MKIVFKIQKKAHFLVCLFIILLIGCKESKKKEEYTFLTATTELQNNYNKRLGETILLLNAIETTIDVAKQRELYKKARVIFKSAEPYLAFSDLNNYKSLNAPNILKVEEEDITNVKKIKPFGFQVIEELLYEDKVNQKELKTIVLKTKSRLQLIKNNNKLLLRNYHVLWLFRDQIARTALTGITGFDSPVLEQSIQETKEIYKTLKFILSIYKNQFKNQQLYKDWVAEITDTQKDLKGNFNAFDRYGFIKKHAHKQLELVVKTAKDWKVEYPFTMALNNDIVSLFSDKTFDINFFSDYVLKSENFNKKSVLGKRLFNDKSLSKNKVMSCATCHQEEKAFTDGLITFSKQLRNTPTLTYAAYQKMFFHDGRSGSLEGQIISVIENPDEFHTDLKTLTKAVKNDESYTKEFEKLYGKTDNMVIRNAIATYIKSLSKFNSKFDNNINDKESTLTAEQVNGFNLFMGKAKCATCHFPPVFNGTVPPNFTDTELEAIGVPNLKQTGLSEDLGRYNFFKTEERKNFFKTPTIRNIERTAPYMHNGTYKTLEEVMDFYNNGGGIGLGFELAHQTLPADSLHLSKKEISDIIAFMKTLNDASEDKK